jgi:hypothetical protein
VDKVIAKLRCVVGEQGSLWYVQLLEQAQRFTGATRVFDRIISASDKDQVQDYFMEVLFSLTFAGLKFEVEFEPLGRAGPDLRVKRDDRQVLVEVMRFRKVYPGPSEFEDGQLYLDEYGNPHRDVRKAFDKIMSKFRQVTNDESIVAVWNDDEELEEIETQIAVKDLREDASRDIVSVPTGLQFVLYGSKWIGRKQLYCFPFQELKEPFRTWKRELESGTVREHVNRLFYLS